MIQLWKLWNLTFFSLLYIFETASTATTIRRNNIFIFTSIQTTNDYQKMNGHKRFECAVSKLRILINRSNAHNTFELICGQDIEETNTFMIWKLRTLLLRKWIWSFTFRRTNNRRNENSNKKKHRKKQVD